MTSVAVLTGGSHIVSRNDPYVLRRRCVMVGWPATSVLILRAWYSLIRLGLLMAYMNIRLLVDRICRMHFGRLCRTLTDGFVMLVVNGS